jgi:hypothetical protein
LVGRIYSLRSYWRQWQSGQFVNAVETHKALPIVGLLACWTLGDVRAINQVMFSQGHVCLAVVAALFSASVRLPAAPCIVTNTPAQRRVSRMLCE